MKKLCSRCEEKKEITEFFRDKQNKDGYAAQCKCCKNRKKNNIDLNIARSHKKMGSCCPKKPVSLVAVKFMSQGNPTVFTSKSTQRRLTHLEGSEAYSKELNSRKDNGHDIEPLLAGFSKKENENDAVPPMMIDNNLSTFELIDQKFPRHKVLSWGDTKAVFQHMDSPRIVFVGSTVDEVLEKALSY